MPQKSRFPRIPIALALLASGLPAQTVYVSRMWHNHQPTYWPEWNSNGSQTNRVEFAWDSIVLKPGRSYPGSTAQHPENNLTDIFGVDDRRNAWEMQPDGSFRRVKRGRKKAPGTTLRSDSGKRM